MKTQFRKATPDDAQKVWHIVWHTKNVIYPDYYTRAVVEYVDRYYTFEIIKSDIEQGRTRVLLKDGEIIGTGSRTDNHILLVYVLPEYQGQGFGSMIMDELDKQLGMMREFMDNWEVFPKTETEQKWYDNVLRIYKKTQQSRDMYSM